MCRRYNAGNNYAEYDTESDDGDIGGEEGLVNAEPNKHDEHDDDYRNRDGIGNADL